MASRLVIIGDEQGKHIVWCTKCVWIINHGDVCFIYAQFLTSVGVSRKWRMNDVYGLDSELLATLPSPALAVLLLFPLNEKVTYLLWSCWMCQLLWLCFLFCSSKVTFRRKKRPRNLNRFLPVSTSWSRRLEMHVALLHWSMLSPITWTGNHLLYISRHWIVQLLKMCVLQNWRVYWAFEELFGRHQRPVSGWESSEVGSRRRSIICSRRECSRRPNWGSQPRRES